MYSETELLSIFAPECIPIIKTKIKEYEETLKEIDSLHSEWIKEVAPELLYANKYEKDFYFDRIFDFMFGPKVNWISAQLKRLKRLLAVHKNKDKPVDSKTINNNDIQNAKQIPIQNFYDDALKKSGNRLCGRCPFHSERTGSFFIYLDTNTWHCFGACGVGGDSISFVMKKQDVGFLDAVKILLNRT